MTAIQPEVTSSDTDRLTKQAARGGGIALVGLLAGQGLTLAVNVMLTRVLGAASYGVFALGQSVVNANQALTTLGATQAVVRFGAMYAGTQDRGRLKGILSLGLLFSVAVNSLLGLMVFLGADFLAMRIFEEPDLARVLKILAFAFPLFAILRVASAGSRSLKRIEYDVGVQQILQPALTFVFVGIAFLLGYRLLGAVGGFLLALMISALVAIWLLIRAFPDLITRLAPIFEVRNFVSFAVSLFFV
jgi:O-antigen/teichoic acid export membrane protein